MKQNIDINQLKELNTNQLKKLHDVFHNPFLFRIAYQKDFDLKVDQSDYSEASAAIKIGIMIEILINNHEKYKDDILLDIYQSTIAEEENKLCYIYKDFRAIEDGNHDYINRNLCDGLWEAIVSMI